MPVSESHEFPRNMQNIRFAKKSWYFRIATPLLTKISVIDRSKMFTDLRIEYNGNLAF